MNSPYQSKISFSFIPHTGDFHLPQKDYFVTKISSLLNLIKINFDVLLYQGIFLYIFFNLRNDKNGNMAYITFHSFSDIQKWLGYAFFFSGDVWFIIIFFFSYYIFSQYICDKCSAFFFSCKRLVFSFTLKKMQKRESIPKQHALEE